MSAYMQDADDGDYVHYSDYESLVVHASFLKGACTGMREENDALAARLAEAERDAARYRWLRDNATWHDTSPWCVAWNNPDDARDGEHPCCGKELDIAVDRAMASEPQGDGNE